MKYITRITIVFFIIALILLVNYNKIKTSLSVKREIKENSMIFNCLNKIINRRSSRRFCLSFCSVQSQMFHNNEYYYKPPEIGDGLYLSYIEGEEYPFLNSCDNREYNKIENLPIINITAIYIGKSEIYAKTLGSNYLIILGDDYPKILITNEFSLMDYQYYYEFYPMSSDFSRKGVHFLCIEDNHIKKQLSQKYKLKTNEISAPKILGITKIGIYHNEIIGSTIYGYFALNLESGKTKYINYNEYLDLISEVEIYENTFNINIQKAIFNLKEKQFHKKYIIELKYDKRKK